MLKILFSTFHHDVVLIARIVISLLKHLFYFSEIPLYKLNWVIPWQNDSIQRAIFNTGSLGSSLIVDKMILCDGNVSVFSCFHHFTTFLDFVLPRSIYRLLASVMLTFCAVISLCRDFPNSRNVGLDSGSCCQHCHMMAYLQKRTIANNHVWHFKTFLI